jgi:hypothetical protein
MSEDDKHYMLWFAGIAIIIVMVFILLIDLSNTFGTG